MNVLPANWSKRIMSHKSLSFDLSPYLQLGPWPLQESDHLVLRESTVLVGSGQDTRLHYLNRGWLRLRPGTVSAPCSQGNQMKTSKTRLWAQGSPCLSARQKSGLDFGREGKAWFLFTQLFFHRPARKQELTGLFRSKRSWHRGWHLIFQVLLNTYYLRLDQNSLKSPKGGFLCSVCLLRREGGKEGRKGGKGGEREGREAREGEKEGRCSHGPGAGPTAGPAAAARAPPLPRQRRTTYKPHPAAGVAADWSAWLSVTGTASSAPGPPSAKGERGEPLGFGAESGFSWPRMRLRGTSDQLNTGPCSVGSDTSQALHPCAGTPLSIPFPFSKWEGTYGIMVKSKHQRRISMRRPKSISHVGSLLIQKFTLFGQTVFNTFPNLTFASFIFSVEVNSYRNNDK